MSDKLNCYFVRFSSPRTLEDFAQRTMDFTGHEYSRVFDDGFEFHSSVSFNRMCELISGAFPNERFYLVKASSDCTRGIFPLNPSVK